MIAGILLLFNAVFLGFLYRLYYLPSQKEQRSALGIVMTEEGLLNSETICIARQYKVAVKNAFFVAIGELLLSALAVWLYGTTGGVLEIFSILLIWNQFFYLYQKYHRKMILLKLDNQWNNDTKKRTCFIREHIGVHKLELANDLVFVPLFLIPFRAFFYPATKEYLQGNLWHGLIYVLPFILLLLLLAVYYKGLMDRNLIFMFACVETAAMYAFQWKLLVAKIEISSAAFMYLLLILLGMIALLPYQRDVKIDEQLYGREFPLSMFSEGEEHWLYGYYRDKNRKVKWGKKPEGWLPGLNHSHIGVKILLLLFQMVLYSTMVVFIWHLF